MLSDPAVSVRRPAPGDLERIGVLVRSLSVDTIVSRFMGAVSRETAAGELCREMQTGETEFALVAENAAGEVVGEAYAAILTPDEAEVAFVVRDREQHHGVGSALLARIVGDLRARGVTTVRADTMAQNTAMLALIREAGTPTVVRYRNGAVRVTVAI